MSDHGPYTMRYLRYFNGELNTDKGKDHCEMRVLGLDHGLRLIDGWNREGSACPNLGVWTYKILSVDLKY